MAQGGEKKGPTHFIEPNNKILQMISQERLISLVLKTKMYFVLDAEPYLNKLVIRHKKSLSALTALGEEPTCYW